MDQARSQMKIVVVLTLER